MKLERALPSTIIQAVRNQHFDLRERDGVLLLERDIALLARATERAYVSAFQYSQDFPIGAVAARDNLIHGAYAAADVRYDSSFHLHAEIMALADAKINGAPELDTLAVTVEPCGTCIENLKHAGIYRVVFAIPRYRLSELGLVNARDGIFSRDEESPLPFEIVQIGDPEITELNMILFRNMKRDLSTGLVSYDLETIGKELRASGQTAIPTYFLDVPPELTQRPS